MAQPTYDASGIVLKKTKLGESDLIITFLSSKGSLFQGVAKGARKPTSTFASRLELYSQVDLLMVQGKSLDIVKEARLAEPNAKLREDFDASCNAAVIAELLSKIAQRDLDNPFLFEITKKAFAFIARTDAVHGALIAAAFVMKSVSSLGFMPSLDRCVSCGSPIDITALPDEAELGLSYSEGGIICEDCAHLTRESNVDGVFIKWLLSLLHLTFDELVLVEIDQQTLQALIAFLTTWIGAHLDVRLKSAAMWAMG